jgi:hypothetical protein
MKQAVRKMRVEDVSRLQSLVAEHIDAIEPGLVVLDSRLLLGHASIDVVGLDATGTLVLVAAGLTADEAMLLKAVEAYSWCREYPESLERLYPSCVLSEDRPPRIVFVAERMPDAFHRKIKQLGFPDVDCVEFRLLEVDGEPAVYFESILRLRRHGEGAPRVETPGSRGSENVIALNGAVAARATSLKLQKLLNQAIVEPTNGSRTPERPPAPARETASVVSIASRQATPRAERARPAAEPIAPRPEPRIAPSEPIVAAPPRAAIVRPEPVVIAQPEPVMPAPEPLVIALPEPVVIATPEPVVIAEPEPPIAAPERIATQRAAAIVTEAEPVLQLESAAAAPDPELVAQLERAMAALDLKSAAGHAIAEAGAEPESTAPSEPLRLATLPLLGEEAVLAASAEGEAPIPSLSHVPTSGVPSLKTAPAAPGASAHAVPVAADAGERVSFKDLAATLLGPAASAAAAAVTPRRLDVAAEAPTNVETDVSLTVEALIGSATPATPAANRPGGEEPAKAGTAGLPEEFEGLRFPNDGVLTRQWMEFLSQMSSTK